MMDEIGPVKGTERGTRSAAVVRGPRRRQPTFVAASGNIVNSVTGFVVLMSPITFPD